MLVKHIYDLLSIALHLDTQLSLVFPNNLHIPINSFNSSEELAHSVLQIIENPHGLVTIVRFTLLVSIVLV